jgi:hypothetical protein
MRTHSIGFVFAVFAIAACGTGVESDPGSTGGGSDPGSGSDPDSGTFHGSSGICPQPDGPRHDFTTQAEATALITGIWVHCAGPTPTPFQGSIGVDINADGKYYKLVSDGHGGMVRATGFSSQGTWDLKDEPPVFVEFWMTPSSLVLNTPLFEDNPRRFAFDQAHTFDFAIYQLVNQ